MNYQESREYIDKITREIPSVLGLEHMRELMKRLGNPQDDLKYVHVAGTNGKGSVIAFLYSALSGARYRIGRYVSPTLYSYRGRMEVSGSRISREDFAAYITQVSDVIAAMTKDGYPHPTAFEIETAVAFLFFKKENCEIYSVSTDTEYVHKAWHDSSERVKKVQYPMIADPTGKLSRVFEVMIEEEGLALRGSFIIDPEGVVQAYEVHSNGIGREASELLRKLQAAKFVRENGEVCPAKWKPGKESLKPTIDLIGKL